MTCCVYPKAKLERGTLRLIIMQGENLPIMDRTTSDPYVIVKGAKEQFKTSVKSKNLNPTWANEVFFFKDIGLKD